MLNQIKIKVDQFVLYVVFSDTHIHGIYWNEQKIKMNKKANEVVFELQKQLCEFCMGKRKKFNIPLNIEGTIFQRKVWEKLQKIPYGKTYSYKELAESIGNKKASRAVGNANGKNPISIIVPCHRVISSSGDLGGYAGGLDNKRRLLEIETDGLN
ncbi:MAG: methylated-DNA--[protein]-cysteine S-methyltransferase [Bacteriovoracaceae bacterium]|jgi:methylated-DNA-[protein]-cysteine S-methyltransferase|nr:methylated-DNA--[protein]-cysteine S-methyltransferase [Bacteriovoracaceae bacterium]